MVVRIFFMLWNGSGRPLGGPMAACGVLYTRMRDGQGHINGGGYRRFYRRISSGCTWEVIGAPWKGKWQQLEDNTYRFVTESRFRGRSISSVDTIRVEFQQNNLKLYRVTCDTVKVGHKKQYEYLLLKRLDKKQTNLGF